MSPDRVCFIENCGTRIYCQGLCSKHYSRIKRNGDPHLVRRTREDACSFDSCARSVSMDDWCDNLRMELAQRARAVAVHVDPPIDPLASPVPGQCWVGWGSMGSAGYFKVSVGGKQRAVHRVALAAEGFSLEGLVVDHLCRNRACFNPEHLEPVTQSQNMQRGPNGQKTHCPYGHPYDEVNTYYYRTHRSCRTCIRERQRKAATGAAPEPRIVERDEAIRCLSRGGLLADVAHSLIAAMDHIDRLVAATPLCPTGYATDRSTPVSPLATPQTEPQGREEREPHITPRPTGASGGSDE